ncbi:rhomboid-like protein [Streptomyces sp. NPDC005423]|uniref:rhomboid-like protein n=1 Tax=Streptomyces sp. NPDC005423 TaxID=3155343 RepID=UPI0033B0B97B
MERTATAGRTATSSPAAPPEAPLTDPAGLLDGVPAQRGAAAPATVPAAPVEPAPEVFPPRAARPARLPLPTPAGTPFTFGYALVLAATSLVGWYVGPAVAHALHQASSTDVAHLVRDPLLVLPASALWIVGGPVSTYALLFLVVLTALERRIGGLRAAGVFLLGHVLATLATEVPVGLAVLAGRLPESSLHRLDYGISFGVAASVGAMAGLLPVWLRWPLLMVYGGLLVQDLITFTDPMTDYGHLLALTIGAATWPLVRRWHRERA